MSTVPPNPPQQLPPELAAQILGQQAAQQTLMGAGLDVPRMFASMIGLSDDPENGLTALVFRDGVRAEFQVPGPDGQPITQTQEAFRTVTSIVLPRDTVMKFVKGAVAHFETQDPASSD